jgi:hypothetical protein
MQRQPLVVAGRAADRLARLNSLRDKLYQSNLDALRGALQVSVISDTDGLRIVSSDQDPDGGSVRRDLGLLDEIYMTPETLVQNGIVHKSLIQVRIFLFPILLLSHSLPQAAFIPLTMAMVELSSEHKASAEESLNELCMGA